MTLIFLAAALVLAAAALFTVSPTLFLPPAILLEPPFAQLLALRAETAVVLLVLAAVMLCLRMLCRNRIRKLIVALTAAILFLCSGFQFSVLLKRGMSAVEKISSSASSHSLGQIVFLTYNTKGGATPPARLAEIIAENGVNVAVLPETSAADGRRLLKLLAERNLRFQYFDTHTDRWTPAFASTVLLISPQLGRYVPYRSVFSGAKEARVSLVGARPLSAAGPKIVGVHPVSPIVGRTDVWKKGINGVYAMCGKDSNLIIGGDFNSTFDHQRIVGARCADAAREAGIGGLGSWPSSVPNLLASPIDRIIHTQTKYRGYEGKFVRRGDSDHYGMIISLRIKK